MPPRSAPPFSSMREPNTASASPLAQRAHQIRQAFRRVLPVAVQQRDEVEAVLDREVVADLLVAAVALVDRVEQHVQRERQRAVALHLAASARRCDPATSRRAPAPRRRTPRRARRHAGEDLADGLLRVVGDDQDEEPGLTQVEAPRRTVPPTRPRVKSPRTQTPGPENRTQHLEPRTEPSTWNPEPRTVIAGGAVQPPAIAKLLVR